MNFIKLALFISLSFLHVNVNACSCIFKTFEEWIRESKTILYGQVVRQEIKWIRVNDKLSLEVPPDSNCYTEDGKYSLCHPYVAYYVKVEKYYKQEIKTDTIIVLSNYHSNCFASLNTGFRYLFYLNKQNVNDIYGINYFSIVSDCTRMIYDKHNFVSLESGTRVNEFAYIEEKFKVIKK